jgi:hypothetical protein
MENIPQMIISIAIGVLVGLLKPQPERKEQTLCPQNPDFKPPNFGSR